MGLPATTGTPATATGGFLNYFKRHPIGFWFIFWGELAERCSYYGMRALVIAYMTTILHFQDEDAADVYFNFKAACYLTPLLGGFIADNYLGKYWTIVIFSVPYIIGHIFLGIESPMWLYLGLAFLAFGTGIIKPNISTLMGLTYDQKRPGDKQLRTDAFYMFYFAINLGSVVSVAILPVVAAKVNYFVAFLVPAILMALALVFFASGKPYYAVEKIERKRLSPEERAERWQVLGRLVGIFSLISLWWYVYDQNDTQWYFFARDHMTLFVTPGWEVLPNQIQAINPFLILVLVPTINLFFKWIDPTGRRFPSTTKILIGFLLMAVAEGLMAVAGLLASGDAKVTVYWMLAAFFILTTSEVLVSTIGLELAFTAAPDTMKSFVTALFLLTVFGGNLINGRLKNLYFTMGPTAFFAAMAGLMVVSAIVFVPIARRFTRREEAAAVV